ncbi:MAG: hypothetical protein AAGF95_08335 [Chloroflexota bacterium]
MSRDHSDVPGYHHLLRRLRTDPADTIWHLVDEVGARFATSLEEAQAAAYLDSRFRRSGLLVSVDTFTSHTSSVGWDGVALGMIVLVAVIAFYWWPTISLGMILLGFALATRRLFRLSRPLLVQRRISQNVIGTRALSQSPIWRVVLLAPIDSPFVISRPLRLLVQGHCAVGYVVAYTAVISLMIAFFMDAQTIWWYAQFPFTTYILVVSIINGYTLFAPTSPGAVSHAGAIAVLLSSAEILTDIENVELWFVGLGATSTGTGINDLLARYPFEQDRTFFISLEGIGHGSLAYITREGFMQHCTADHFLLDIAAKADSIDPFIDIEPRLFYDGLTLGGVLRCSDWRVLTITCLNDKGRVPYYASMSDKPHIVDTAILDRAIRMVVGCVRQIDSVKTNHDTHS